MVVLIVNDYTIKLKANVGLFMRNIKYSSDVVFDSLCYRQMKSVHLIHIKRNGNPIWHVRFFSVSISDRLLNGKPNTKCTI